MQSWLVPVSDLNDEKITTRESFWQPRFYAAVDLKLNFYLLGKQQWSMAVR